MGRLRIFAVIVVFSLLAPVVVCVVPGAPMTTTEADCCRHMSAPCGSEESMADCCIITVPDLAMTAPAAKVSMIHHPIPDAVVLLTDSRFDIRTVERRLRSTIESPSPPGFSSSFIPVFRI